MVETYFGLALEFKVYSLMYLYEGIKLKLNFNLCHAELGGHIVMDGAYSKDISLYVTRI